MVTESTRAILGPLRHHATNSSNLDFSPWAITSTLPLGKFLTVPFKPSSTALSLVDARKNTPWTLPRTCISY